MCARQPGQSGQRGIKVKTADVDLRAWDQTESSKRGLEGLGPKTEDYRARERSAPEARPTPTCTVVNTFARERFWLEMLNLTVANPGEDSARLRGRGLRPLVMRV